MAAMLLMCSLCTHAAFAADERHVFLISTTTGETIEGTPVQWAFGKSLTYLDTNGTEVMLDSLRIERIRLKEGSARPAAGEWELLLVNGTRLIGEVAGGEEDRLRFRSSGAGESLWPMESIRFLARSGTAQPSSSTEERDRVALRNGDILRGTVTAVDRTGLTIILAGDEAEERAAWRVVDWVRIDAAASLIAADALQVRLVSGEEISAVELNRVEGGYRLRLGEAMSVDVDDRQLLSIESPSGGRVWLSSLPVARYESIPYFSIKWPMRVDANVVGEPLRLGEKEYERGLGLHSSCRATWALDGGYSRLTGLVGVDGSAGRAADADFVIRTGEVVLFEAKSLRAKDAPKAVDLDVKDLREITIEVGFGRNGDVQDRVNFVNAALIR